MDRPRCGPDLAVWEVTVLVCVCRVLAMRTKEVRVGFQEVVFKLILKLLPTWLFKFKYNAIEYNRIINLVPQLHQPYFKCSINSLMWLVT